MKKRYDKTRHKEQFIESGSFCVPLEYYLELSEKKRKYMFLNTKLILDQMVLVEQNTCIIRKGLSESRCLELARSVISIADAFKEAMNNRCTENAENTENISEESFGSKEGILEQQGWDEFKKWRFVNAYSADESIIEEHKNVIESVKYTERGVIFDYIYETWKQAVLNKDVSDTCVSNVSVNESIQAIHAKADFQQRQQDRMKAYLGHLKGGDYVMLDGR